MTTDQIGRPLTDQERIQRLETILTSTLTEMMVLAAGTPAVLRNLKTLQEEMLWVVTK